jgi:NADPH2:quinone reductase
MQAVTFSQPGQPDVLQPGPVPTPEITQPDHLLIKLYGAGVNPIDTKLRQRGTFYPEQMPAILGCDGAGVVEAVGSAVSQFKPGDAVYYCCGGLGASGTGNYAEYAVIPEHFAAPKPERLSFLEAAAAPLVLITAWEALYDRARLTADQTVLIQAGAGGVGHVAIQLAKLRGARVCTTVSTMDKARLVRQLGADEPILYPQTDVTAAVLAWTEGTGVDVAFDTVGGATFFETVSAVRTYGDLVTILEPDLNQGSLKEARKRNHRISLELMLTPMLSGDLAGQRHHGEILRQCGQWFDQGKLNIHVAQHFPLAEAAAAHRAIEMGSTTGKVVLAIGTP